MILEQTETYYPWHNEAEGGIKELKRGASRKILKDRPPKRLWDDGVELDLQLQSHTSHNIHCLNIETPETIMSGETSDMSQFCELEWYEQIIFRDLAVSFPEDKMVLGRYLVPSIDIGPAMTVNILKSNGEVVHRSTYQDFLPEDLERFDLSVAITCGPGEKVQDFYKSGAVETPEYDTYKYDTAEGARPKAPPEELEPTPNAAPDNYLNASVVLP